MQELALYEQRLAAQRAEAGAASGTLGDALKEMAVIHAEKKQLLLQWQSTLVAISKRDEALQVWDVRGKEWGLCVLVCVHVLGAYRAAVWWSPCVPPWPVGCRLRVRAQATHAAVRKQKEEEERKAKAVAATQSAKKLSQLFGDDSDEDDGSSADEGGEKQGGPGKK